jgi:quercetin dioxygenase-like cupin family protein
MKDGAEAQMIVKSANGVPREFKGVSFDVLSVGKHMMVTRMRYQAGDHVPAHQHPNEQAGYVTSGRFRMQFGGHDQVLESGDSYVIPGSVEHTLDVIEAGDVIDVFCPPRQDYSTPPGEWETNGVAPPQLSSASVRSEPGGVSNDKWEVCYDRH